MSCPFSVTHTDMPTIAPPRRQAVNPFLGSRWSRPWEERDRRLHLLADDSDRPREASRGCPRQTGRTWFAQQQLERGQGGQWLPRRQHRRSRRCCSCWLQRRGHGAAHKGEEHLHLTRPLVTSCALAPLYASHWLFIDVPVEWPALRVDQVALLEEAAEVDNLPYAQRNEGQKREPGRVFHSPIRRLCERSEEPV